MGTMTSTTTVLPVAVYLRISADKGGYGAGVDAQRRWALAYCEATWPGRPVVVYCDNDKTASKKGAQLPDRDRLLADVVAGKVGDIWVVEQSRLQRRELDWFTLADDFEDAGITEVHTNRNGVLGVRDITAGIGAVVNADEVRKLTKRVRDTQRDAAYQGRPPGGTKFGYRSVKVAGEPVRLEVIEEQAALVHEAAHRVLTDDEPLSQIAADWDARGERTPSGARWVAAGIKSMLTSYTVAGKRCFKGEQVSDGDWDAILDTATWEALRAKLLANTAGRGKGKGADRAGRRKYVLSGLLYCSTDTDTRMVGHKKSEGRWLYLCKRCGRAVRALELEDHVVVQLLTRLDDLADLKAQIAGAVDAEQRRSEITAELEAIRGKRTRYGEMLAADEMDEATYAAARSKLAEQENALSVELAGLPTGDDDLEPDELRKSWPYMSVDDQRAEIAAWIDRIEVDAAPYRGAPPVERVTIRGQGWS